MTVAEMKIKAIEGIMKLNEEKAIEQVLNHNNSLNISHEAIADFVFDKTVSKFNSVLQKLAQ